MGGFFSSPPPPPAPPPPPPPIDDGKAEREARAKALERQRRGRGGTIATSDRGLLETNDTAAPAARKTLLGE